MIQKPGCFVYTGAAPELVEESNRWDDAEILQIQLIEPGPLARTLEKANLTRVRSLILEDAAAAVGLEALASQQLPQLRELRLRCGVDFPCPINLLERVNWLDQLEVLSLAGLGLRGGVGEQLSALRELEGVTRLSLTELSLSPTGLASMVIAPHLGHIQVLKLNAVNLTDHSAIVLANSLLLRSVERLDLSDNPNFRDIGVVRLFSRPRPHLQVLALADIGATADIAAMVASEATLPRLQRLDVSGNVDFGDGGLFTVTQSSLMARLEMLKLDASGVGDPGVLALAGCPDAYRLRTLTLRGRTNPISDEGALALIRSPHLRSLERLEIHPHHLSDDARIWMLIEAPDGLEGLSNIRRMLSRRALLRFAQQHNLRGVQQFGRSRLLALLRARLGQHGRESSFSAHSQLNSAV